MVSSTDRVLESFESQFNKIIIESVFFESQLVMGRVESTFYEYESSKSMRVSSTS